MHNQTKWIASILTWGLVFTGLGVLVGVAGLVLTSRVGGFVAPAGLVPGISLMLIILGFVGMAQYAYVRSNPKAGRQMIIQEQDERLRWIRAQAGQRAYRISSSLAFLALIWAAFAGDIGLPPLSGNALYFTLLAIVVLPYLTYIASMAIDRKNS